MPKNEEQTIWDDSALLNAFNDAISKYKKMHNLESSTNLRDGENVGGEEQILSAHNGDAYDSKRKVETRDLTGVPSNVLNEMGKASPPGLESEVVENFEPSSNGQFVQSTHLQNFGDYDHLVRKYYEIEEQRQKVVEQLNQLGYWNNAVPVTSQENQAAVDGAHSALACSVCPYGCQSWVAPCSYLHSCCVDVACAGKPCQETAQASCNKETGSWGDNDFVNMAMVAAERALSSLQEQASTGNDAVTDEGENKNQERCVNHSVKGAIPQTDLTVVLNAWYSAGFYTGKYLSEQASAKDRHG